MKINRNFLVVGGVRNKKPSMGGVWIFSGTAHYLKSNNKLFLFSFILFRHLSNGTISIS